ncbi:hypothetical protein [Streptomyces sp900116325]|uniref:hypothetical protein n=1 Tax=Streptomyces sp. 900116325 TaxID=3154295 RepID=UPI0033BD52A2
MEIDDTYVMWAAENYGDPWDGIEWYNQGCVGTVKNSYGSVRGSAGRPMDEIDVHVFLKDGVLTYDCGDCYASTAQRDDGALVPSLCPHAVAVALTALDLGATWYEIPDSSERPQTPMPRGWDSKQIQRTLLGILGDADAQVVLRELIQQHTELVPAAEQVALRHLNRDSKKWAYNGTRNVLMEFDPAQVEIYADSTKGTLTADFSDEDIDDDGWLILDQDEMLLAYGMRPLIREITKRASAGAFEGSRSVLFGILSGLYSCHDQAPWTEPEITDHAGTDLLYAVAYVALSAYGEWTELPGSEDLQSHCAGWTDRLLKDIS